MKGENVSCSVVSNSVGPHGLKRQAPLSMGFSRPEYWSGIATPLSRGSPQPEILHCRQIPYHLRHQGSRNTQFLSSRNILIFSTSPEGKHPRNSSQALGASLPQFFFFRQKTCESDIVIVYSYLRSASIYSTHYKEVTGDPKSHCNKTFQGRGVRYSL